jgi:group II intron reverse transcriptase/maturase
VLRLIRQWLSAGVMEDGVTISGATGVPQGGSISPLLSNVYGHALDALWAKEARRLGTIVRYADDAVILCRSEADAQQALRWLQRMAQALKLTLHPEKTRVVELGGGVDGFDFLGFHHRLVKSRRYAKWYCQRWPSGRAMASIRAKVKAITASRSRLKEPTGVLVAELNLVLRGWGNYFRWGNSSRKFSQIDSYVHERLALFDSKKRQKTGRRWTEVHTCDWIARLGVHRLSGTVRYGQFATGTT